MANSEQEDILDGLVHIYECDEQHVSALIIPTDGEIREDLPVYIEDAESDTIYATTTTDTYGMTNTTFSLSPGTHTPTIKCGSNKHNIYDTSVVCHACSLTLTSDKDILSATDGDIATLTATLIGTESGYNGPLSGREVAFEIYQTSDDTFVETLTATTNSSGVATVSYSSQGIGDISIVAKVGSLVSKTYELEDCLDYQVMTDNSKQSHWTIPSAVTSSSTFGYSSNGWKYGNASSYSVMELNEQVQVPLCVEFYISNVYNSSNYQPILILNDGNNINVFAGGGQTSLFMGDSISVISTNNILVKIELKQNEQKLYINDVLKSTKTTSLNGSYALQFHTGANRWVEIKDFKIKPL